MIPVEEPFEGVGRYVRSTGILCISSDIDSPKCDLSSSSISELSILNLELKGRHDVVEYVNNEMNIGDRREDVLDVSNGAGRAQMKFRGP